MENYCSTCLRSKHVNVSYIYLDYICSFTLSLDLCNIFNFMLYTFTFSFNQDP
ncbi:hypothetical protein HanIR_Chr03g0143681 [Helianthus annuus]|nr:hypothetical protein HanIR_Chr03g0143681 [Helianthus annuus]